MHEEWRIIQDYPNYSVSNLGRVRNDKTGLILKIHPQKTGKGGYIYLYVYLYQGKGIGRHLLIHRLVATAFIQNPGNKPEVNHLDGNPYNNAVGNLEWTSRSENMMHAREVLHRNILYPPKKVIRIEDGKVFDSITEAAKACGIKSSGISACLHGYKRRHTAGGYHWKFYEE